MATAQEPQVTSIVSLPTDRYLDAVEMIPVRSHGEITGTEHQNDSAHTFSIQPFYTHQPELRFGLVISQEDQGYGYPKPNDDPAMKTIQALAYKDSMTNFPVQSEFLWNVTQAVRNTLTLPQYTAYKVFLEPLVTHPSCCAPLADWGPDNIQPTTTVYMRTGCNYNGIGCVYLGTVGQPEAAITRLMLDGSEAAMIDGMSDYRPRSHSGKHLMSLLLPGDSSQAVREEHAARVKTATKWRLWKTFGEHAKHVRVDVSVDTDTDWPKVVTPGLFEGLHALYDV